MAETSADIIDFIVYRKKRRTASKLSHETLSSVMPYDAVVSLYFLWPFLAWVPFGSVDLSAPKQGPP